MLWILLTVMTAVAAAGLALPLVRRHDARRGGGADGGRETVAVLKAQLAELDAEAAARALPDSQARSLRVETQRRILAAGEEIDRAGRPLGERSRVFLGLGMAAVVALGGLGLY
ncbi:MAG: c-type cytochrome biogenesis protein CcmI, partial [Caulobacteraceae bacterium]